jgi:hypothetical protein
MVPALETKARLDQISDSFCPLRWTYMQVDLEHGRVKACCKTPFQQVSAGGREVIFDSTYFQERRREMLKGVRHSDCECCWEQERLGLLSYRLSEAQKEPHAQAIRAIAAARQVTGARPKHIEFILSTLCDLKCTYCGPDFSTAWVADVTRHGPFPMAPDQVSPPSAPEGFREMFWDWFADSLPEVEYIQFNGGEPLIQPEFYAVVRKIMAEPVRLQLGVISNLNTPAASLESFRRLLPGLLEKHSFRLGVSQDSIGARAEFIRQGLRWSRFDANLRALLREFPTLEVQVAPTMSALNVTSVHMLLRYLDELGGEFGPRILLRPSVVMWPEYLAPWALPPEYSRYLDQAIDDLERIGRWPEMSARLDEVRCAMRPQTTAAALTTAFIQWAQWNDARRGSRITRVFPELTPLFEAGRPIHGAVPAAG